MDREEDEKLDELDRMLNDPDSRMEPSRVWSLLAEISEHRADRAVEGPGALCRVSP